MPITPLWLYHRSLKIGALRFSLAGMRRRSSLSLLLWAVLIVLQASAGGCGIGGNAKVPDVIYLKRDLSSSDLSQWTHRDYGLGTDVGENKSGAGFLWYHPDVAGRRAAGLTVTPQAHASPAVKSDSVYLWEPASPWNYKGQEIWLRTSVMFPSATMISSSGLKGEAPFVPTVGEWNWFLEFHNDSSTLPPCAKEFANISLTVKSDDPGQNGVAGGTNPRLALRIMGSDSCAPKIAWIDGPSLQWDHWYEMFLRIKWDPSRGIVEWYVDNFDAPYYSSLKIPTLFTRPRGYVSPSYTTLTVPNYRLHAPWNSTIYLGPLAVGSTKSSVLNAF